MSEFSDRPFVAGSLIGLRAFRLDKYGRLYGPCVAQVFRPGDNEAECRKDESRTFPTVFGNLTFQVGAAAYPFLPSLSSSTPDPASVTYGSGPCPCGCGMGVEFKDEPTPKKKPLAEAAVEKPKPVHTLAGVNCTCGFYAYFDGRNDYKEPNNVAAIIEGFGVCTHGSRGFRASKARLVALVEPKKAVPVLQRDYLHRNYEGVPFYASKSEALTAHPLTQPDLPALDEPDFWTRPVA